MSGLRPRALLTHRAAADAQDLLSSARLEVTVPPRVVRGHHGITDDRRGSAHCLSGRGRCALAQRLIVEVDSKRWHDGPFARRDDHRRQAVLEAAGYAVLRVCSTDPPDQTIRRIGHAIGARSKDHPR